MLFSTWLARGDIKPVAIHTHVPIGAFPVEVSDAADDFTLRQVNALFPRRIDVALVVGNGWWIVECKPDADHHALGQVLAYRHWWREQLPDKRLDRCVVLTDKCQTDCKSVFAAHEVGVIELGQVLVHAVRRSVVLDSRDFV